MHKSTEDDEHIPLLEQEGRPSRANSIKKGEGGVVASGFIFTDHPVCALFGGFADFSWWAQPPLLFQEGTTLVCLLSSCLQLASDRNTYHHQGSLARRDPSSMTRQMWAKVISVKTMPVVIR